MVGRGSRWLDSQDAMTTGALHLNTIAAAAAAAWHGYSSYVTFVESTIEPTKMQVNRTRYVATPVAHKPKPTGRQGARWFKVDSSKNY